MALTAVVTLNSAGPVPIATELTALVTVSNSGTDEVFLTNAIPTAYSTAETLPRSSYRQDLGTITIPANSPVPAGGSLDLTFPVVFQSGTGLTTNSVGCQVYGADGSVTEATPATIEVTGNNQYA